MVRMKPTVKITAGLLFIILSFMVTFKPGRIAALGIWGVVIAGLFGQGMIVFPFFLQTIPPLTLAACLAMAMAANDAVSWYVGITGRDVIDPPKIGRILRDSVTRYGAYAVFVWSLIPFPFDIIGVFAGYLGMGAVPFLVATFSGRFVRFLLLGYGVLAIV